MNNKRNNKLNKNAQIFYKQTKLKMHKLDSLKIITIVMPIKTSAKTPSNTEPEYFINHLSVLKKKMSHHILEEELSQILGIFQELLICTISLLF